MINVVAINDFYRMIVLSVLSIKIVNNWNEVYWMNNWN